MENTLVFGLGNLGAVFSLFLQRSKRTSLSTVARSNFDAVQKEGIYIEGVQLEGGHVIFDHVYHTTAEPETSHQTPTSAAPFSYVVVTTKRIVDDGTTPTLVQSLEPFVVPGKTTIVLIQNGVGIEPDVQARWPDNLVLSCIAFVHAVQPAPNRVVHTGGLLLICGPFHSNGSVEYTSQEKERIDTFVEMCKLGGCDARSEYNHVYVQAHRWTKLAMNASWNALMTLSDVDSAAFLAASPLSEPLARRIIRDTVLIARGLGIEVDPLEPGVLSPEEAERAAAALARTQRVDDMIMDRIKGHNTSSSTRTDAKAGRALEYEVIWGHPLKQAKRLGIDVPVFETVAVLIEAIDARNRGKVKSIL